MNRNPTEPEIGDFYKNGGYERNHVWLAKPGTVLKNLEGYLPTKDFSREATPELEARHQNVDMAQLPSRVYFDVHYKDLKVAKEYGLTVQYRRGEVWPDVHSKIEKSTCLIYSENRDVQKKAIDRWARLDISTGKTINPPGRYDARQRGGGIGR